MINIKNQSQLFKQLWLLRERKSFISGKPIGYLEHTDRFVNIFAHILAKGQNKYSHFKLLALNIAFLTDEEHHLLDHGSESQRIKYEEQNSGCDWDRLYELRDYLKELYEENFPRDFMGIINYKYDTEEVLAKVGQLNKEYFNQLIEERNGG